MNLAPLHQTLIQFHLTAPNKKKNAPPKKLPLLVIPFFKEEKGAVAAVKGVTGDFSEILALKDFTGKEGETAYLYPSSGSAKRLLLLGLGERKKVTLDTLRCSFSTMTKRIEEKEIEKAAIHFPQIASLSSQDVLQGMVEGVLLAGYSFTPYKTEKKKKKLGVVDIIGGPIEHASLIDKLLTVFKGVYLARDLVNGSADEVTPAYLAAIANKIGGSKSAVKVTILNKRQLEKEKLGLILSVARGSVNEPYLIVMEYMGAKKSKENILLVGKGVTYDTGGLNLKPTGSMENMRCDMGGAATVLALMQVIKELKLPLNIAAIIPTTENGIDANSYKPGDVYTSYAGKTVEITNTDAEGRLILADAISYGIKKMQPTCIIDYATLTGAIMVALGDKVTGMMSSDDMLAEKFAKAGLDTYERVWRMPIYEEYGEALKSDVADFKNAGDRLGGAITAALFLQKFVENIPWVHFDIAGTAYLAKEDRYLPKGASGVGIRLTLAFLDSIITCP